jgi:hypothetical protein
MSFIHQQASLHTILSVRQYQDGCGSVSRARGLHIRNNPSVCSVNSRQRWKKEMTDIPHEKEKND